MQSASSTITRTCGLPRRSTASGAGDRGDLRRQRLRDRRNGVGRRAAGRRPRRGSIGWGCCSRSACRVATRRLASRGGWRVRGCARLGRGARPRSRGRSARRGRTPSLGCGVRARSHRRRLAANDQRRAAVRRGGGAVRPPRDGQLRGPGRGRARGASDRQEQGAVPDAAAPRRSRRSRGGRGGDDGPRRPRDRSRPPRGPRARSLAGHRRRPPPQRSRHRHRGRVRTRGRAARDAPRSCSRAGYSRTGCWSSARSRGFEDQPAGLLPTRLPPTTAASPMARRRSRPRCRPWTDGFRASLQVRSRESTCGSTGCSRPPRSPSSSDCARARPPPRLRPRPSRRGHLARRRGRRRRAGARRASARGGGSAMRARWSSSGSR